MAPLTGGASPLWDRNGRPLHILVLGLIALGARSTAAPRPLRVRGTAFLARGRFRQLTHATTDSSTNGSKVRLDIYYESLCPQSLRTLNSTFREAWSHEDLRRRISLNLVAFGNAQVLQQQSISQGYQYWHPKAQYPLVICQHGETECLGNKIHACAVDLLKVPEKYVPFILCMAAYGPNIGVEKTSYECAQKLGTDMDSIKECAYSPHGHSLHVAHGTSTLDPQLNKSYVPWVMINGVHDKTAEGVDLVKQLCSALDAPKPGVCVGGSGAFAERKQHAEKTPGKNTTSNTTSCGDGKGKGGSGGDFF